MSLGSAWFPLGWRACRAQPCCWQRPAYRLASCRPPRSYYMLENRPRNIYGMVCYSCLLAPPDTKECECSAPPFPITAASAATSGAQPVPVLAPRECSNSPHSPAARQQAQEGRFAELSHELGLGLPLLPRTSPVTSGPQPSRLEYGALNSQLSRGNIGKPMKSQIPGI